MLNLTHTVPSLPSIRRRQERIDISIILSIIIDVTHIDDTFNTILIVGIEILGC